MKINLDIPWNSSELKTPESSQGQPIPELQKIHYDAKLEWEKQKKLLLAEEEKIQNQTYAQMEQAGYAYETSIRKALLDSYLDVSKKEFDRMFSRSEFIQKVAIALSGAYVAVVGLSFSLGKDNSRPLPAEGIIPTIFFGLCILLVTVYLAFIQKPGSTGSPVLTGLLDHDAALLRNEFIDWASQFSMRRLWCLHSAVLFLGLGVIYLPCAFIALRPLYLWISAGILSILAFAVPLIIQILANHKKADTKLLNRKHLS